MKTTDSWIFSIALLCIFSIGAIIPVDYPCAEEVAFRPPAVPLITHDPYLSIWSVNDRLTDGWTRHWTGKNQGMAGLVRIDGTAYRIMGPAPESVPAMNQVSLQVFPTRSVYRFEEKGIAIDLTFLSPLLANDLKILARPVSYITWTVQSIDQQQHVVELYFDITGEWVVDHPNQAVEWSRFQVGGMNVLRMGTVEQPVLAKQGDDLRIDWGYGYLVVPPDSNSHQVIASDDASRSLFAEQGKLPLSDDLDMPRPASDRWPVMANLFDCGTIGSTPVSRHIMLAYDDLYCIEYFQRKLLPYWRNEFEGMSELIQTAANDYESLEKRCAEFDRELMADLQKVGGKEFERICTLAYRQCLAAHKLASDFDGTPLHFSKENFSNGCIATVDVIYPAAPLSLLFNTELVKAQLTPLLDYSSSKRWRFPFAPHDLGTYPQANGQRYGGGEKTEENQMPVEESGNMILILAAMAQADGCAEYVRPYWPTITRWAEFLKEQGMDPSNQLCTDDFAGHLAHNTNLSLKAILALGGYSQLGRMLGYKEEADQYLTIAKEMANQWMKMADDGDHYRLAFDKPGTWSQKYNLVWDQILGLNLFPADLAKKEIAYYKTVMQPYGLPLDNRKEYTKFDWEIWTATLTETPEDFSAFIQPIYRFLQETPDRVPMSDWYWTQNAQKVGFQARSVIGGVYIPMLTDSSLWKKWSQKAQQDQ